MKVKMVATLTLVCVVCSLLLTKVYNATLPKIERDIAMKLKTNLMKVVFPHAKEYKQSTRDTSFWVAYDSSATILGEVKFCAIVEDTVWSIIDTTGEQYGIAFKVFPKGYGGPIEVLVGLKRDTTVTGIRTARPAEGLKETPGLGVKVNEPWFEGQFIGKKQEEIKLKKDGGTLDAITAATISARAVTEGVRKGVARYKKYLKSAKPKEESKQKEEK